MRPSIPLFLLTAIILIAVLLSPSIDIRAATPPPPANPPIYIAFLWHMHQPIYWPYESVVQTDLLARYSYSVTDIHNQRTGPYTSWPKNAVQKGITAGLSHLGAQVSFSGSLIENLNNLEANGNSNFQNWKSSWNAIRTQTTALGNPRIDMVGFGYHHPLMGLIDTSDIRRQIDYHKQAISSNFTGGYSKGIFPPENAFSPRTIPALVGEGLEWVLVDNIHFDRTCQGYPFSTSGNLYEPNKADIRNPDPGDWVQLNGVWAPTRNSARWGRLPHLAEYIDPASGAASRIIVVPTDRYLGNEDGRGGFGALNYDYVMSQLEPYNTDPNHPILIVLHHDGDNYGGGTDSYYNSNFQNFVNWLTANPSRFICTTVQDYLDQFPPDPSDVIHVEDGSWSGADNGDPEFKKWNGDPAAGYSPDRNSWGVITAAKNIVATAQQINPSHPNMQSAWKYLMNGEASDYWYWDGSQNGIWDSHPARAANQAVQFAQPVIGSGTDRTPPTIYLPQREPYNPGATEWGINKSNTMTVWTYVYDVSGLKSVTLKYRTDLDGVNSSSSQNETYAGGNEVSPWTSLAMTGVSIPSQTNPVPLVKAEEYSAVIAGLSNVLVDYYVESVDSFDNVARSPILHVWIGQNTTGGGSGSVSWTPAPPSKDDSIRITVSSAPQGGKLHWGVNNNGNVWQMPNGVYRPAGSTLFNGTGPAVESPMAGPDTAGNLHLTIGPFNNVLQIVDRVAFVIHYNNGTWDNNGGQDYHITVGGSSPAQTFMMDGVIDTAAMPLMTANGLTLYAGWNGQDLYLATPAAPSQGGDLFIMVADSPLTLRPAPWAKSGSVAGWSAFLGNESSNNYAGWFNSGGSPLAGPVMSTSGAALEGTINLQSMFGKLPPKLYLALIKYQTQDGGTLLGQVPAGNGNSVVEANEFLEYDYLAPPAIPAVPVPAFPPEYAADISVDPLLRWHPSAGASRYWLQLGIDSTFFTDVIADDSTLVDTGYSSAGLSHATDYFWRISAANMLGRSAFSGIRHFRTVIAPPPAPLLVAPADNSDSLQGALTFRWNATPSATSYRLTVARDYTFTILVIDDSALVDTMKAFDDLYERFYWKVRARNAGGYSPYSLSRTFRRLEPFPISPQLLLPADGATGQPVSVILVWDSVAHASSYRLSLAADSLFSFSILEDSLIKGRYRQAGPLSKLTQYFWRVRGQNTRGEGEWSAVRRFITSADSVFTYTLHARWNLISIPFVTPDNRRTTLFPTSAVAAYAYDEGNYVQHDTLRKSSGYWLKLPAPASNAITGVPLSLDTIAVRTGWNLIGTIADTLSTTSIGQEPPGIIVSDFFTFTGSYQSVTTLLPGTGYWVKSGADGKLILGPRRVYGKIRPPR